jgi:hypothetical protein
MKDEIPCPREIALLFSNGWSQEGMMESKNFSTLRDFDPEI